EHHYNVVLVYPDLFPEVPAYVRSETEAEIWSEHQYRSGTFCLEWGPDTWHPSVTGAQLLTSTFHLIDIEKPHSEPSVREKAPTRHQLSLGQQLRFKSIRVFLTKNLHKQLASFQQGSSVPIDYHVTSNQDSIVLLPFLLKMSDGEQWKETA